MQNPCTPECPDRTPTCRLSCGKYKSYAEHQAEKYAERAKGFVSIDFRAVSCLRNERRKRR